MMRLQTRPKHREAFTLIELLVVIGIIAGLSGLLFPVLISARASAGKATCLSNLHQIGAAIALYAQDYDEYLPYAPDCDTKRLLSEGYSRYGEPLDSAVRIQPDIRTILLPYNASAQLFKCPLDRVIILIDQPNFKPTWFEEDGSSYQYNDWDALLVTPLGYFQQPSESFLMGDDECFHDTPSDFAREGCGFFNVLHMDFHVKSLTASQRQDVLNIAKR